MLNPASFLLGPYAKVYVGDTVTPESGSPPVTDPFFRISAGRTRGSRLDYAIPTKWSAVVGNDLPDGNWTLDFGLTFYGNPDQAIFLAAGNSINPAISTTLDMRSDFMVYSMVLVHADPDVKESIYIPICKTKKRVVIDRSKQAPTAIPIAFDWEHRDFSLEPFYKDTYANVVALATASGRILQD